MLKIGMSDIFARPSEGKPWLKLVPLAVVLAIGLLEYGTPSVRIAPSLLTISVALFALFLSSGAVLIWSLALFLPVVATLMFLYNNGLPEPAAIVLLRTIVYVVVATMAFLISRHREKAEKQFNDLLDLFDSLQKPVVVSDADGNVIFANRACCTLLGRSFREVQDSNFFSLFSNPEHRGTAIEYYLSFFGLKSPENPELNLAVQGGREMRNVRASCSILSIDDRKLLISQLS
jgi:PAS domain S-box-containing protein